MDRYHIKQYRVFDSTNPNELLAHYYYGGVRKRSGMVGQLLSRLKPTKEQKGILVVLGVQALVTILFYQWWVTRWFLYPFQLISTVFHEFGHAFMCVTTGGRINSIHINPDESGLTRFSGGWSCFIAPAGYIGSTVVGAILMFSGFDVRASKYASISVNIILAITLYWAGSLFTVVSSILLMGMTLAAHIHKDGAYLRYFVLFMGVIGSLSSLLSIISTTVFREIEGSDAVVFARNCSFLVPSVVYGFLWLVISLLVVGLSICGGIMAFK